MHVSVQNTQNKTLIVCRPATLDTAEPLYPVSKYKTRTHAIHTSKLMQ